jgi:hypothetical protein
MATTDKVVAEYQEEIETGVRPHGGHFEGEPVEKHDREVILKSSLDDLGLWTTVKRFRKVRYYGASMISRRLLTPSIKAVILCNLICIAAAADGFQYTLNGRRISLYLSCI